MKALDVDRFYHGYALPPSKPSVYEATVCPGEGGKTLLIYSDRVDGSCPITMKTSDDKGRSWDEPRTIRDRAGTAIEGCQAASDWYTPRLGPPAGTPGATAAR